MSFRAAAPVLLLAVCAPGAAWAQLYGPFYDDEAPSYPLPPPLALPQHLNGTIRGSSEPVALERVDRIRDVFAAMRACWRAPSFPGGPTGLEFTLRTSYDRSGWPIGKPQITYFRPGGGRGERDRFAASISDAFSRCTPLPFTTGFGSAVAGRPFTFRFIDDRKS
jgi:hypothetical protein